jgi:CheY-like chemotaxis protein
MPKGRLDGHYLMSSSHPGVEAVEKARQLRPDAITLDILMPGGSGFETLSERKKTGETAHIPIIVVSVVD